MQSSPVLPVARDYAGAAVLKWTDLDPRLGVSWDLFGNGRTAIKASASRYIEQEGQMAGDQAKVAMRGQDGEAVPPHEVVQLGRVGLGEGGWDVHDPVLGPGHAWPGRRSPVLPTPR